MLTLESKHIHFAYNLNIFSFLMKGKKVFSGHASVREEHGCEALLVSINLTPTSLASVTLLPKSKEVRLHNMPESIAQSLPSLTTADDWLIITKLIKELRNPETSPFSDNEIKRNLPLMAETSIVPYAMLFPFSDFISHENIKKFGEHWPHDTVIITDGYCTTPSCECNNAGLVCQVFSAQKKEKIATMSFFVDLITHRVSSIEKSQNWNNGITPEYIVDAIKKCEPRFIQNLVERRARIRKKVLDVFGPSFLGDDSNSTEPLKPFVRTSPKIGRNEKCPCGSNKKYKHCCGI